MSRSLSAYFRRTSLRLVLHAFRCACIAAIVALGVWDSYILCRAAPTEPAVQWVSFEKSTNR